MLCFTTSYVTHRTRQHASCRLCIRAVTRGQCRTRSLYTVVKCFVINNYLMQLYFIYLLRFSKSEWSIIYPSFYFNLYRVPVFWWHPRVTLCPGQPSPGSSLVLAPVTGTVLAYKAPTPFTRTQSRGSSPPGRNSGLLIIHSNIQHCHKFIKHFSTCNSEKAVCVQLSIIYLHTQYC